MMENKLIINEDLKEKFLNHKIIIHNTDKDLLKRFFRELNFNTPNGDGKYYKRYKKNKMWDADDSIRDSDKEKPIIDIEDFFNTSSNEKLLTTIL